MSEPIDEQFLFDFLLGDVSKDNCIRIIKEIETDEVTRNLYLKKKRELDIERYLNNDMPLREKIQLKKLLKKDPILKKQFNLRKDVNDFIIGLFSEQ